MKRILYLLLGIAAILFGIFSIFDPKLPVILCGIGLILYGAGVFSTGESEENFACILFLGSCILCTTDIHPQAANGMPLVAAAGMIFSIALAIYTVRKMTKKK